MRLTYVGHATTLIEIGGLRVLTDPLLRPRVAHLRRIAPPVPTEVLEHVDLVLISHAHHDHLDVPSLKLIAGSPEVLCPEAACNAAGRTGLQPLRVRTGDVVERGNLRIEAVSADHDGRRWPTSPSDESLGFVLRSASESIYFAGDTGLFDGLEEIREVEVALLPVAGWGPRLGPGHLDAKEAARAAALIMPRVAVPIHWGSYRRLLMGEAGAPDAPAQQFAAHLGEFAPSVAVRVLQPGESLSTESQGS